MANKKFKFVSLILILALILGTFAACGGGEAEPVAEPEGDGEVAAPGEPVYGGTLVAVIDGDPPTMDCTMEGSEQTFLIARYIWEGLLTMDQDFEVAGMLAEDWTMSEDGTEFTFMLRDGVNFHDGTVLSSADVVASLERWYSRSEVAQDTLGENALIEAPDDLTVTIKCTQSAQNLINILAYWEDGFYVMPKSVIDAAAGEEITEDMGYIGTGPYKFDEFIPDNYLLVSRFEDYSALEGGADGLGGTKYAYFDAIKFVPVSEGTTVIAGLKANEYDIASISNDVVDQVESVSTLDVVPVDGGEFPCVVFNKANGPTADVKIRQAICMLANCSDIMGAAFGEGWYELHPGFMPSFTSWSTGEIGAEYYNQNNLEGAKALLEEAGYNGEVIRYYTTQTYDYMYKNAMVLVDQMKAAGLNIELNVVDWATLSDIRAKEEGWEIFSGGFTFKLTPLQIAWMRDAWPGFWVSEDKTALLSELQNKLGTEEQYGLWEQLTQVAYDEAPVLYFGEYKYAYCKQSDIQGEWVGNSPYFWNLWFTDGGAN